MNATTNNGTTSNAAREHEAIGKIVRQAAREALAAEMERAVNAAHHVGRLKQSQWYQDRKALLAALPE